MIAALVLAAGRGARFATDANKLLQDFRGRPLLRRTVDAALASRADKTIVVTGHDHARVDDALAGLPIERVYNGDHAEGVASSLRAGFAHAEAATAIVVLLGDMPNIAPALIDRLIARFEGSEAAAVIPVYKGRRGNPVLIGRALFPLVARLAGDVGARNLLRARDDALELDVDDAGVLADVDTSQDLRRLRAEP